MEKCSLLTAPLDPGDWALAEEQREICVCPMFLLTSLEGSPSLCADVSSQSTSVLMRENARPVWAVATL